MHLLSGFVSIGILDVVKSSDHNLHVTYVCWHSTYCLGATRVNAQVCATRMEPLGTWTKENEYSKWPVKARRIFGRGKHSSDWHCLAPKSPGWTPKIPREKKNYFIGSLFHHMKIKLVYIGIYINQHFMNCIIYELYSSIHQVNFISVITCIYSKSQHLYLVIFNKIVWATCIKQVMP